MFNDPTTRPEVRGLYEVQPPIRSLRTGTRFYAYWTGRWWSPVALSPERALDGRRQTLVAVVQNKPWKAIPQ